MEEVYSSVNTWAWLFAFALWVSPTIGEQVFIKLDHAVGGNVVIHRSISSRISCANVCDQDPACLAFHWHKKPVCELITELTGTHETLVTGQSAYIKTLMNGSIHDYVAGPINFSRARAACGQVKGKLVHPIASAIHYNWLKSFNLPIFLDGSNPSGLGLNTSVFDPEGNDVTSYINWSRGEPNKDLEECLYLLSEGLFDSGCKVNNRAVKTLCSIPNM